MIMINEWLTSVLFLVYYFWSITITITITLKSQSSVTITITITVKKSNHYYYYYILPHVWTKHNCHLQTLFSPYWYWNQMIESRSHHFLCYPNSGYLLYALSLFNFKHIALCMVAFFRTHAYCRCLIHPFSPPSLSGSSSRAYQTSSLVSIIAGNTM